MKKERVYISGKMSGLERSVWREHFGLAEKHVRSLGYRTVNPARFPMARFPWLFKTLGYTATLLIDLWVLSRCDRIYLIPGWRDSRGAEIESFFAYKLRIRRLPEDIKRGIDKVMEEDLARVAEGTNKQ